MPFRNLYSVSLTYSGCLNSSTIEALCIFLMGWITGWVFLWFAIHLFLCGDLKQQEHRMTTQKLGDFPLPWICILSPWFILSFCFYLTYIYTHRLVLAAVLLDCHKPLHKHFDIKWLNMWEMTKGRASGRQEGSLPCCSKHWLPKMVQMWHMSDSMYGYNDYNWYRGLPKKLLVR